MVWRWGCGFDGSNCFFSSTLICFGMKLKRRRPDDPSRSLFITRPSYRGHGYGSQRRAAFRWTGLRILCVCVYVLGRIASPALAVDWSFKLLRGLPVERIW